MSDTNKPADQNVDNKVIDNLIDKSDKQEKTPVTELKIGDETVTIDQVKELKRAAESAGAMEKALTKIYGKETSDDERKALVREAMIKFGKRPADEVDAELDEIYTEDDEEETPPAKPAKQTKPTKGDLPVDPVRDAMADALLDNKVKESLQKVPAVRKVLEFIEKQFDDKEKAAEARSKLDEKLFGFGKKRSLELLQEMANQQGIRNFKVGWFEQAAKSAADDVANEIRGLYGNPDKLGATAPGAGQDPLLSILDTERVPVPTRKSGEQGSTMPKWNARLKDTLLRIAAENVKEKNARE